MARNENVVILEDVRIFLRNFAGKGGEYNRAGDRNFAVLLDDRTARAMEKDGWNIKWLEPREDGDNPQAFLSISVSYKGRPPKIVMLTMRGRTNLTEDEVELLDWADILTCDLIIRPYDWLVNGKSGRKAYLQSLFATIDEDPLERKYADVGAAPRR